MLVKLESKLNFDEGRLVLVYVIPYVVVLTLNLILGGVGSSSVLLNCRQFTAEETFRFQVFIAEGLARN